MIFRKIKGVHIDGRRNLSLTGGYESFLSPQFVYVPLSNGSTLYQPLVKVNDVVLKGQAVAQRSDRFGHPVHSSVSGVVTSIKKMWHPSGKMLEMLEIKNDFLETCYKEEFEVCKTKEEIIERVKKCGIVGMGGAGFPTYVKYMSSKPLDTVIINAAECEPYLTVDDTLMRNETDKFLKGIEFIMQAAGANKAYIAIKKSKKQIIDLLNKKVTDYPNISVFLLNDVYPTGWERVIVEKITNKHYDYLPADVGVVVNNVQTAIAVYEAVTENKPLIERAITVTGEGIKKPHNIYVKIGTKASELIPLCGGYKVNLEKASFVVGGPMTGKAVFSDEVVITATTSGVIVLPDKTGLEQACLGCGKCAEKCPAFLVPTEIKRANEAGDMISLDNLNTLKCVQCGLCSYVCPSRISITEAVGKAQDALRKYKSANANKKG